MCPPGCLGSREASSGSPKPESLLVGGLTGCGHGGEGVLFQAGSSPTAFARLTGDPGHQLQGPQHAHSTQCSQVEVSASCGQDPGRDRKKSKGFPLSREDNTPLPPPASFLPKAVTAWCLCLPLSEHGAGTGCGSSPAVSAEGVTGMTFQFTGIPFERTLGLWPPYGLDSVLQLSPSLNHVPKPTPTTVQAASGEGEEWMQG